MDIQRPKVMAVASSGHFWDELVSLKATLGVTDIVYATSDPRWHLAGETSQVVRLKDSQLARPASLIGCVVAAVRIIRKHRPGVVVTTGSAAGLVFILVGRTFGARTLWIDSLSHAQALSPCGKIAKYFASECWVQWEHLARGNRVRYFGAVL